MTQDPDAARASETAQSDAAGRLNRGCFCVSLDRKSLAEALDHEVGVKGFSDALERSHPLLFSNVSVFVPAAVLKEMTQAVAAVEAATSLSIARRQ